MGINYFSKPADAIATPPAPFNTLQLGWYTGVGVGDTTRFARQVGAGDNLQTSYDYVAGTKAYLDNLQANGMKGLLGMPASWIKTLDSAQITNYVNTYKGHAALAGWYLVDEPEENGISAATVQKAYTIVKTADPNHPIAVAYYHNNCTYVGKTMGYGNLIGDIVMFERYPVFSGAEFTNMSDWRQMVDDCQSYLATNARASYIGFIANNQGFNWAMYGGSFAGDRDPTYKEARYMAYRGLIKQSNLGLQWWIDYGASANLKNQIDILSQEIRGNATGLRNGKEADSAISVNKTNIKYKFSSTDGLIIAVNDSSSNVTANITLPVGSTLPSVMVTGDRYNFSTATYTSRTIATKLSGSRYYFTDTFNPFEVHVYSLAPLKRR